MVNLLAMYNGRGLFSSNDCGLAAGTCHLAKYQVRIDIRMPLLDVIPVLVGATPIGATIITRTGIMLCSVMTINALRLCISFAAGFAQVWAFEHFTHDSRLPRRPQRRLDALISRSPGLIGLASRSSFHKV